MMQKVQSVGEDWAFPQGLKPVPFTQRLHQRPQSEGVCVYSDWIAREPPKGLSAHLRRG